MTSIPSDDLPVAAVRSSASRSNQRSSASSISGKKNKNKPRPSRTVCQERLACKGDKPVARFSCAECKTVQCEDCDTLLHENARFEFHERNEIPDQPADLICAYRLCEDQNYADLFCHECNIRICFACDPLIHASGRKQTHCRIPHSQHLQQQLQEQQTQQQPERGEDQTPDDSSTAKHQRPQQRQQQQQPALRHNSSDEMMMALVDDEDEDAGVRGQRMNQHPVSESSSPSSASRKKGKKKKQQQSSSTGSSQQRQKQQQNEANQQSNSNSQSESEIPTDCQLPDVAQMSLEPPNGEDEDYFLSADYNNDFSAGSPDHGVRKSSSSNNMSVNIMSSKNRKTSAINSSSPSFLVLDEFEQMQMGDSAEFAARLGCGRDEMVKVVSIFGNTGEGKSHTLNFTFFGGNEVFKTSPAQSSCTIGIWAAFDPKNKVITIDTEGLLGVSENNNRRTRLLLKVLAISDIIIYRTRAERLHNDLFTFLGDASRAYGHHFASELQEASKRSGVCYNLLGPVVVVFHETLHTDVLQKTHEKSCEDELRRRFQTLGQQTESFSAFEYVGTRTKTPPTSFRGLQEAMRRHLTNTTVRSARKVSIVFSALKHLNEKFSGDIEKTIVSTFPDEYFTCSAQCESCNVRCTRSLNHHREDLGHFAPHKCKYQHQFDNKVYYCKACNERGEDVLVVPKTSACNEPTWIGLAKYAWYGYVLECTRCGIIYRSRQYWYGNSDPFSCVHTEILHIWPGESNMFQGTQNAAQKVIDGIQYITSTAQSISAKPTRQIGSWVADQIAPSYWVPNSRITQCRGCDEPFGDTDVKHHCRACGDGFCDDCSSKTCEVPDKGWDTPVRVCDGCYERRAEFRNLPLAERSPYRDPDEEEESDDAESESFAENQNAGATQEILLPRKAAEVISSTIGNVASAIEMPINWIKDNARPEYWEADKDISVCIACTRNFQDHKLTLHHCRACGKGVCDDCSRNKRPVKTRGWDAPVRVCDSCAKKSSL